MQLLTWRWWFTDDRTGSITIVHPPNRTVLAASAASAAARLTHDDSGFGRGATTAATALWTAWGVDEMVRGVNPWRRSLGAAALMLIGLGRLRGRR